MGDAEKGGEIPRNEVTANAGRTGRESTAGASRRRFLAWLGAGLGGIGAILIGIPFIGSLLQPRRRGEVWRPVAQPDDLEIGATVKVSFLDPAPLPWAGFAAESAAWLRREAEGEFVAFSMYCTHTGCPVRWEEGAQLFFCPCHGGAFYRDGQVASGPPPAPLGRHPVRIRDGMVELRTIGVPVPDR